MNIPGVTDTTPNPAAAKTPAPDGKPVISTDYQMFLKMLTAQMKNQDPLKPIDSTDYATQLATFSGVEQQVKTNQLLSSLTGQLGVSGMGQVATWVGMEARAPVSVAFTGQPITLYPNPAKTADKVVLVAYDATGHEVTRQDIAVSPGPIQWPGTSATGGQALHGSYTFKLENYTAGKLTGTDTIDVYSRIKEARLTPTGAVLLMEGGDTVAPNNITALRP
mgnify:CR=1 FL=1